MKSLLLSFIFVILPYFAKSQTHLIQHSLHNFYEEVGLDDLDPIEEHTKAKKYELTYIYHLPEDFYRKDTFSLDQYYSDHLDDLVKKEITTNLVQKFEKKLNKHKLEFKTSKYDIAIDNEVIHFPTFENFVFIKGIIFIKLSFQK